MEEKLLPVRRLSDASMYRDAVLAGNSGGPSVPCVSWGIRSPKVKRQFVRFVQSIQKHCQSLLQRSMQRRNNVRCKRDHSVFTYLLSNRTRSTLTRLTERQKQKMKQRESSKYNQDTINHTL